jgi:hypothetical protein
MHGLYMLRKPEDVAELRGISVAEVLGLDENGKKDAKELEDNSEQPRAVDAPAPGREAEEAGDGEAVKPEGAPANG